MKPGEDLRKLKNFTKRQAKQFRYKLPEDFYEIDLALQVLIHKLDPKKIIENVEKFEARKTVLVIDGLTELYATFDLEDELKEKISAGIKKLRWLSWKTFVSEQKQLQQNGGNDPVDEGRQSRWKTRAQASMQSC